MIYVYIYVYDVMLCYFTFCFKLSRILDCGEEREAPGVEGGEALKPQPGGGLFHGERGPRAGGRALDIACPFVA